jgi:uncharacterized protein YqjF (DUF2071 family)
MASKFHCTNPSDNWIVAVDNVYMGVSSRNEAMAMAIYVLIGDIEESIFGSACVLPPQYTAVNIHKERATESIQSFSKRVNPDYVAKRVERYQARDRSEALPLHARLAIRHQFDRLFH